MHETTVGRAIASRNLSPVVNGVTVSTPVQRVGVTWEHKVAVVVGSTGADTVSTIFHALSVFPITTEVVIVVSCLLRFTRDSIETVVIVNETAHTETFVVNDVITKVYTIDCAVTDNITRNKVPSIGVVEVSVVSKADGIVCAIRETIVLELVGIIGTHFCNVNFGVVLTIRIHVRTLEEVDTNCWRYA